MRENADTNNTCIVGKCQLVRERSTAQIRRNERRMEWHPLWCNVVGHVVSAGHCHLFLVCADKHSPRGMFASGVVRICAGEWMCCVGVLSGTQNILF